MPYPLTPTPARSYTPAYGGIPSVPSPISTAGEAVAGNIGNLGGLYQLAGGVNLFNQQQAPLGLQTNLPGYAGMIGQSSQNIMSNLAGQVPQDVVNQIAQGAAERGTATGLGAGSPNANAALLRALGLTSLGQQQLGEQELTAAIGRTPQGPLFDPSKFFVTPEQEQQAQAAANLYASAPVPSAAAAEARKQGAAGLAGGGGTTFAPTAPSPIRATTWGGGGGGGAGGASLGTGLTYGGITYPEGTSPQTAATNWNQWYAGLPKSTGTGSTYMGAANPMYADEYDQLFGLGGGEATPPVDTAYNPVTNTSNWDPFMGAGSFWAGGTGTGTGATTVAQEPSLPDLFGSLTPEDLAGFM